MVEPSSKTSTRTFTLASRASKLAQIQTNSVLEILRAAHPNISFQSSFMNSDGDRNKVDALYLLGGKSLWTKDLEVALKENTVDMLVHSLKDVSTTLPDGCELGAILEREDPVDSLVVKQGLPYKNLEELPEGSVVGTSSVRRIAQLRKTFPSLQFADMRGNIDTRLSKLDSPTGVFTAIILAKAGLVRYGASHRITSDIAAPVLFHAVGQGALGVEIRSDDAEVKELCKSLSHWPTDWACRAERAMLRVLEGGCSVPVGTVTTIEPLDQSAVGATKAKLTITGTITAIAGNPHVGATIEEEISSAEEADAVGQSLAKRLKDIGGQEILEEIVKDREAKKAELQESVSTAAGA